MDCIKGKYLTWRFWTGVYLLLMALVLSPKLIAWGSEEFKSIWNTVSQWAVDYPLANAITAIALTCAIAGFLYRCHKSQIFSISLVLWGILVLTYSCQQSVARIPICGELDYAVILVAGSIMLIIIELLKLFRIDKVKDKTKAFHFTSPEYFDDGRMRFAESLTRRIQETCGKESFAVGISGSWGSGKTSFLQYVYKSLENKEDIKIWFYPWNSNSADSVITDFFNLLSEKISPLNNRVKRELHRYASSLTDNVSSGFGEILSSLFPLGSSLEEMKKSINDMLEELPGRVYVFIDDMDRLDRSEIMEVLKLIRNTANFSKITYIVAFDREYVTETIDRNGIGRANDFIEKIFYLEITLPEVEGYAIPRLIWYSLRDVLKDYPEQRQILLNQLLWHTNGGEYYITRFIGNYRSALRFANVMGHHVGFLGDTGRLKDLDFRELFWLEVLRCAYPDEYNILYSHRQEYLEEKGSHYELLGKTEEFDSRLKFLLNQLFRPNPEHNSIAKCHNFGHYFALRTFQNHISSYEFGKLLEDSSTMKETLDLWLQQKPSLSESLHFHFSDFNLNDVQPEILYNYVKALCLWTEKTRSPKAPEVFEKQMNSRRHNFWPYTKLQDVLRQSIADISLPIQDIELKISIVNKLLPAFEEQNGRWYINHVLDSVDIIEIMKGVISQIEETRPITPEDVFDSKSLLHKVLQNTSVAYREDDDYRTYYNPLLWPHVYTLLEQRPKGKDLKTTLSDFKSSYEYSDGEDGYDFDEMAYDDYIGCTFGSLHAAKIFCKACFEGTDAEKQVIIDKYLR